MHTYLALVCSILLTFSSVSTKVLACSSCWLFSGSRFRIILLLYSEKVFLVFLFVCLFLGFVVFEAGYQCVAQVGLEFTV